MGNKAYERIALVAISIAAVAVIVNMIVSVPELRSDAAASWVQAVGSIAAILGAFEISRRQGAKARQQAIEMVERANRQRIESVRAIVVHAEEQARAMAETIQVMPYEIFKMTMAAPVLTLDEAAAALSAVPLHELGSYEAVSAITGMQKALASMRSAIDKYISVSPLELFTGQHAHVSDVKVAHNLVNHHAERFINAAG